MTPHLIQFIAAVWLMLGHASYWYALSHYLIDLYEFFGHRRWMVGAAVVTFLGPLTIPTYYILIWGWRR